jgi:hypothetical protein
VFWTTEACAGGNAFAARTASDGHAAAAPAFTGFIAAAGVITGETLVAEGLSG